MTSAWSIDGVRQALEAKEISARELAADFFGQIEKKNPELNAYLTLSQDRAYAQADRVDALVASGKPLPPLAGVLRGDKWKTTRTFPCPNRSAPCHAPSRLRLDA